MLTSARTKLACPPAASTIETVSWPPSASTSATTTLAPSRLNTSADARPMPLAAPVTTATFPSKAPMGGTLPAARRRRWARRRARWRRQVLSHAGGGRLRGRHRAHGRGVDPVVAPAHAPPAGSPDVVVVVLDDVGFADLGCFGSA